MDENKPNKVKIPRQRTLTIAVPRAEKAARSLQLLTRCAKPSYYEYSAEDVKKLLDPIKEALADCEAAFNRKDVEKKDIKIRL
jgi:hypothetical protein